MVAFRVPFKGVQFVTALLAVGSVLCSDELEKPMKSKGIMRSMGYNKKSSSFQVANNDFKHSGDLDDENDRGVFFNQYSSRGESPSEQQNVETNQGEAELKSGKAEELPSESVPQSGVQSEPERISPNTGNPKNNEETLAKPETAEVVKSDQSSEVEDGAITESSVTTVKPTRLSKRLMEILKNGKSGGRSSFVSGLNHQTGSFFNDPEEGRVQLSAVDRQAVPETETPENHESTHSGTGAGASGYNGVETIDEAEQTSDGRVQIMNADRAQNFKSNGNAQGTNSDSTVHDLNSGTGPETNTDTVVDSGDGSSTVTGRLAVAEASSDGVSSSPRGDAERAEYGHREDVKSSSGGRLEDASGKPILDNGQSSSSQAEQARKISTKHARDDVAHDRGLQVGTANQKGKVHSADKGNIVPSSKAAISSGGVADGTKAMPYSYAYRPKGPKSGNSEDIRNVEFLNSNSGKSPKGGTVTFNSVSISGIGGGRYVAAAVDSSGEVVRSKISKVLKDGKGAVGPKQPEKDAAIQKTQKGRGTTLKIIPAERKTSTTVGDGAGRSKVVESKGSDGIRGTEYKSVSASSNGQSGTDDDDDDVMASIQQTMQPMAFPPMGFGGFGGFPGPGGFHGPSSSHPGRGAGYPGSMAGPQGSGGHYPAQNGGFFGPNPGSAPPQSDFQYGAPRMAGYARAPANNDAPSNVEARNGGSQRIPGNIVPQSSQPSMGSPFSMMPPPNMGPPPNNGFFMGGFPPFVPPNSMSGSIPMSDAGSQGSKPKSATRFKSFSFSSKTAQNSGKMQLMKSRPQDDD